MRRKFVTKWSKCLLKGVRQIFGVKVARNGDSYECFHLGQNCTHGILLSH